MDEYISREAAIDEMRSLKSSFRAKNDWDSGYDTAIAEAFEHIKRVPVADVQPVKHGYWIKQPEKFQIHEEVINSNYLYLCSCCNASDLHSERANNDGEVKFCWRCGARMDGDSE